MSQNSVRDAMVATPICVSTRCAAAPAISAAMNIVFGDPGAWSADGRLPRTRVETRVNVGAASASPLGGVAPVVLCDVSVPCSFPVTGFDTTSDGLLFRMSAQAEAGPGVFVQPGPPFAPISATIAPATGVYTRDPTLATLASVGSRTFYSTQVTIESLTPAITGTVPITDTIASRIALDFLIELMTASGTPPAFDQGPIGEVSVARVGKRFRAKVGASDVDKKPTLTMNAYGLPLGAKMDQARPSRRDDVSDKASSKSDKSSKKDEASKKGKVSGTLIWKPTPDQVGYHLITFVVNDSGGRQTFGSMVVAVVP